jgi:hypothetical protein
MAGYPITPTDLNNRAGDIVVNLRRYLQEAHDFKGKLDGWTDAYLTATVGLGSGDVTALRNSFTDLDKLYQVAHALAAQSPASDFFFNAGQLTGVI